MVFQRLVAHGLARLKLRASPLFLPWFYPGSFLIFLKMLTEEAGVPSPKPGVERRLDYSRMNRAYNPILCPSAGNRSPAHLNARIAAFPQHTIETATITKRKYWIARMYRYSVWKADCTKR